MAKQGAASGGALDVVKRNHAEQAARQREQNG